MIAKPAAKGGESCLVQLGCLGVILLGWGFLATLPYSIYCLLALAGFLLVAYGVRTQSWATQTGKEIGARQGAMTNTKTILVQIGIVSTGEGSRPNLCRYSIRLQHSSEAQPSSRQS